MIDKKEMNQLMEMTSDHCVSIFIPTFRVGQIQEDHLRFKNALSKALEQLQRRGFEKDDAHKFLTKGYELLDDDDFWTRQSDGLAAFISKDHFSHYTLPIHFEHRVETYTQFYIRPLMPMFSENNRFFLLALSQNEVRFFEGNRHSITPVKIEDLVPENMEAALMLDDPNGTLQMHNSGGDAIFHGQGGGKDKDDAYLKDYFRQVDKGLMEMLHDEDAPMILATVDRNAAFYKEISEYSNLLDTHISGNPEGWDAVGLHERAWQMMTELKNESRKEYQSTFGDHLAENKASTFLTDVIPATVEGKVESIFMDKDATVIGTYDSENHKVEVHEERQNDSYDLLEFAARNVFLQGGKVYNVAKEEFPNQDAEVNAVYRF
ncbi:MAG: hypothetical protein AAGG68_05320 [Bacteroidota bacterium]